MLEGPPPDLKGEGHVADVGAGEPREVRGERARRGVERGRCAPRARGAARRAKAASAVAAGASSSTTCALVPPKPKELTPARRGAAPRGQGRSVVLTKKGPPAKGISGLGAV